MVTIGGQTPFEAIKEVQKLLDSDSYVAQQRLSQRRSAGRFARSDNERLAQAADLVPELGKQWRRSGKLHNRWNHDLIDGQVVGAREFMVTIPVAGSTRWMRPHDPNAPVEQVIHCGCVVMRPWKSAEAHGHLVQSHSAKELAMDGRKAALEQARNRAGKNPE